MGGIRTQAAPDHSHQGRDITPMYYLLHLTVVLVYLVEERWRG